MRSPLATMSGSAITLIQCVTRTTQCVRFASVAIAESVCRPKSNERAGKMVHGALTNQMSNESIRGYAHLSALARQSTDAVRQVAERAIVADRECADAVRSRLQNVEKFAVLADVEIERRAAGAEGTGHARG